MRALLVIFSFSTNYLTSYLYEYLQLNIHPSVSLALTDIAACWIISHGRTSGNVASASCWQSQALIEWNACSIGLKSSE
jgi:hypothetical protein